MLAATHPNVRCVCVTPFGWPGAPGREEDERGVVGLGSREIEGRRLGLEEVLEA